MSSTLELDDFVRVGNVGTEFNVTMTEVVNNVEVVIDFAVDALDSSSIEIRKPRGQTSLLTSAIKNPPGNDGIITATDGTGIFDVRGRWACRGVLNFTGGNIFKGSWAGFTVGD